jgi:hypothetical protein
MDAKARKQFPQHHRHSFAYSAGGGGGGNRQRAVANLAELAVIRGT